MRLLYREYPVDPECESPGAAGHHGPTLYPRLLQPALSSAAGDQLEPAVPRLPARHGGARLASPGLPAVAGSLVAPALASAQVDGAPAAGAGAGALHRGDHHLHHLGPRRAALHGQTAGHLPSRHDDAHQPDPHRQRHHAVRQSPHPLRGRAAARICHAVRAQRRQRAGADRLLHAGGLPVRVPADPAAPVAPGSGSLPLPQFPTPTWWPNSRWSRSISSSPPAWTA